MCDDDVFEPPSFEDSLDIRLPEAMSIGIPEVATVIGGVPEIIENHKTGILINLGDIKGLFSSIIDLIDNRTLRRTFAYNARNNVATDRWFTTGRMAGETLRVCRSIVEA